jgi:hypothetical protein
MSKNIRHFVDQQNKWNAIFGGKQYDLETAEDRETIAALLDSELSPENLSCDGELSLSSIKKRLTFLQKCQTELKKLDPSIEFF